MRNPIPRMHPFLFRGREFSRTHFKLEFARLLLVVRRYAHRVSFDAEDEDERDDEGVMERA